MAQRKTKKLNFTGTAKGKTGEDKRQAEKKNQSLSTIVLINVIQKCLETNKISAFKVSNYCFTSLKILNYPRPPQRNRLKIILERG